MKRRSPRLLLLLEVPLRAQCPRGLEQATDAQLVEIGLGSATLESESSSARAPLLAAAAGSSSSARACDGSLSGTSKTRKCSVDMLIN